MVPLIFDWVAITSLPDEGSGEVQKGYFMLAIYCYVAAGMHSLHARFDNKDKGATAVEYGLMVALIAVVIIVAVTTLGGNISKMFETVAKEIPTAAPAKP